ncbi:GntR family transcriptional regulator [Pseudomonas protegens]|uniref:GntR family transcriptional regulator n=1 Tax=Pseudomonas protegens TaxID=380021 RepID=UPI001F368998|nr:GntR family transcriptional regulator [Pseudomonas protegens]
MIENTSNIPAFVRVANEIRNEILCGRILSGASLIEAELIDVYGVSRNTLRESLQLLRQQGLLSQERNKSVRVKRLSAAELKDIFVVRRAVELTALRGRKEVPADWLLRLGDVTRESEQAVARLDWPAAATTSLRFHQEIVALHQSPIFDQMFSLLVTQLRLVFVTGAQERTFQDPWLKRETEIHALLSAGQCDLAAERLEAYLTDAEAMLMKLI